MTTNEERMQSIKNEIIDLKADLFAEQCELMEEYGDDAEEECYYYESMIDSLSDAEDSITSAIYVEKRR